MPRREAPVGRRRPVREARPRILIVCGGERTEPQYFIGLRNHLRSRAVDLRVVPHPRAPAQIVEYAGRYRPDDFDEVWCVFDVDEFDIGSAVTAARSARIHLAVSNPCFELWLLLHHEHCRAELPRYKAVAARLRKHEPSYDKTDLVFARYAQGLPAAISRAKELEPTGQNHQRNPSTSVWRLVEMIEK